MTLTTTATMAALTPEELAAQAAFQNPDLVEHIRKKAMWAGSTSRTLGSLQGAELGEGGKLRVVSIQNSHTPAFFKMLDELIVNASDHWKEKSLTPGGGKHSKVTRIKVTFEPINGVFSIENDGPGIPVILHDQVSKKFGRPVYLPEVAFCVPLAGSNMEKGDDNVKGGINGVGAKIANIHSSLFRFITVYYASDGRKIYYNQKTEKRMSVINPPEIVDLKTWPKDQGPVPTPHTCVKLMPAYYALGYPGEGGPNGTNQFTPGWAQNYSEILMILRLRCCHLAAYVGPKVAVTLNDEAITTTSATSLAGLHLTKYITPALSEQTLATESILTETQMKPKDPPFKAHPWTVAAVISPHVRKFDQVSIINGVETASGSHLVYIKELLKAATLKRLQTQLKNKDLKTTVSEVSKHMLLIIVGALPRANWTGQRKDELSVGRDLLKNYTFTQKWMKETSEGLCQAIMDGSLKKKKKKTEKPDKYTPAKHVDKKPPRCKLMLAEGDSAITLLRAGMTLGTPGTPTFYEYGIYSLGGVPMNAMKQVDEKETATGTMFIGTKTFNNNKVLQNLFSVLGLEPGTQYNTEAEVAQLHYAGIIICVDGDVDGAGKIAGLILATFFKLWPGLLSRGYVQWFMTPVIRVYPASAWSEKERARVGPLAEFYHEQEFHAWEKAREEQVAIGGEASVPKVMVRYYKGLGTHEPLERPKMFENFEKRLYTFAMDDEARNLFEVHYGKMTGPRKEELSRPLQIMPQSLIEFMDQHRVVPCGVQLTYFTKAYKIDALERQLPNALDSMTVGRRKAFDGARERFGDRRGECQTFQLAGYVADRKQYHHGGVSMENAIIYSCQNFEGARVVPFLIGSGEFGTRLSGGQDAASARYTRVSLNTPVVKWLMPREDDTLLPYEFVDGQRAEPKSYVPIICCSVLDHNKGVTEGWNFNSFARKPSQVMAITKAYCLGDPVVLNYVDAMSKLDNAEVAAAFPALRHEFVTKFPLDVALQGLKGEIRVVGDRQYHLGIYSVDERETAKRGAVISFTELPIRKWSNSITALANGKTKDGKPTPKADLIQDATDYSGKKINITVTLKPGALDKIRAMKCKEGFDPIETFFELYTSLRSDLNVIRPVREGHGGVMMFGEDYHSIVAFHLPIRRRYYTLRFERRRLLLELEIRMTREVIRYIEMAETIQISKYENESDARLALRAHNFPRIHMSGIRNPGFTPVEEIPNFVVEAEADQLGEADHCAGDWAEPQDGEGAEATAEDGSEAPKSKRPSGPTYNYLLNLRERDLIQSALEKRRRKVVELEEKLESVRAILLEKPFAAASVWSEELGHLEKALVAGGYYE